MEDEGSYGNDDIRCFILSNLATARMAHAHCLVCQNAMTIYDRYPLIDGTFFLSPKQYSKACIPVSLIHLI
jgi:headcase protein